MPLTLEEFTRDWLPIDRAVLQQTMSLALEVRIAGGGTTETIDLARRACTPLREIVLEPSSTASAARGRGL